MMDEQNGSRGIEMHEAHFPGRAPVEAYGNGGFRFAEMSHQGSILCLPEGIFAWHVEQASELTSDHFERVFSDSGIDVFLLGLGPDFLPMPKEIRAMFEGSGIVADPMSTGAAIRTYNVLLGENRAVGCGLIAVD